MSILAPNSTLLLYRDIYQHQPHQQSSSLCSSNNSWANSSSSSSYGFSSSSSSSSSRKGGKSDNFRVEAFWQQSAAEVPRPVSVEMVAIENCDQLDQILLTAQQSSQPIVIDWMAAWCRKCIYLKPKLEKLAAEYDDTKIKFYCVDVNKVPLALVKRGNISKMPTIQLWKDGEMKEEVIGGHKAWLVLDEVREMIQKFL